MGKVDIKSSDKINENPSVKAVYKSPDDPTFVLFYIDVAEVETFSMTEGPKSYKI